MSWSKPETPGKPLKCRATAARPDVVSRRPAGDPCGRAPRARRRQLADAHCARAAPAAGAREEGGARREPRRALCRRVGRPAPADGPFGRRVRLEVHQKWRRRCPPALHPRALRPGLPLLPSPFTRFSQVAHTAATDCQPAAERLAVVNVTTGRQPDVKTLKLLAALTALLALVLGVAACGGAEEGWSDSGGGDLSGEIVIDGSSTVAPLTDQVGRCSRRRTRTSTYVSGQPARPRFKRFCTGEPDIWTPGGRWKPRRRSYAGRRRRVPGVRRQSAVVVVRPDNPVSCMSPDQLSEI